MAASNGGEQWRQQQQQLCSKSNFSFVLYAPVCPCATTSGTPQPGRPCACVCACASGGRLRVRAHMGAPHCRRWTHSAPLERPNSALCASVAARPGSVSPGGAASSCACRQSGDGNWHTGGHTDTQTGPQTSLDARTHRHTHTQGHTQTEGRYNAAFRRHFRASQPASGAFVLSACSSTCQAAKRAHWEGPQEMDQD